MSAPDSRPVRAGEGTTSLRPSFQAGSLACTVASDGELPLPPALLFASASPEERERAFAGQLDENGMLVGRYNPLLIRGADAVVLVDTGIGRYAQAPGAGRLLDSLAGEGTEPGDIDVVVLTHAHPDHLGGLMHDGEPVFSQARHVILAAEWDFWTGVGSDAVPEPMRAAFDETVATIHALGRLDVLDAPADVAPALRLSHAPGHTPGHAIVELGDPPSALFLADAVLHEIGFEHPEWTSVIDVDPERTVATRRALLQRAAEEGLLVAAYHVGRRGYVRRDGSAFRLVAQGT